MNIALLVSYIMCGIALFASAALHGKKRSDDKYNLFTTAFGWAIRLTLMWWALGWRFA